MICTSDGCENPCEGTTLFCATHNYEQRKAERDSKKVKVIKPINKVSEKRADELKEYPKKKKQYLEFKMHCEIKLEGCTKSATQIHHCSKDAKNFLNTDTWKGACAHCHHRVEFEMPAEQRRELGLLTD